MPTRLIRDGLLTSWRYERLSVEAKLFLFHLFLCADDLGCVELGPTYIRRRVLFSQDSDERIARLIGELVDVDLLRTYAVDSTCYGFIPRFAQRVQIKYAKYPMPPESLFSDDQDAETKFKRIKLLSQKTTVGQPLDNGSPDDGQHTVSGKRYLKPKPLAPTDVGLAGGFEEFWSAYPKKRSKGDALKAWRALKPNEQLRAEILAGLQRAMNSAQWRKDDGQFIPHPATWLRAKGWEDEIEDGSLGDVTYRHGQARVGGFVP